MATLITSGVAAKVTSAAIANAVAELSSGDIRGRRLGDRLPAGAFVVDHGIDRLVHRPSRLPAGELPQRAGVGPARAELLEPVAVGLGVGDEHDLAVAARASDHTTCEVDDADRRGVADVERPPVRVVALAQQCQRLDGVAHMCEAPDLPAA